MRAQKTRLGVAGRDALTQISSSIFDIVLMRYSRQADSHTPATAALKNPQPGWLGESGFCVARESTLASLKKP